MIKVCYLMVGVPGSGKSTMVKAISAKHIESDVRIFSQDSNYISFCSENHIGQFWSDIDTDKDIYSYAFKYMMDKPKEFSKYMDEKWKQILEGEIIFIDRTNLTRKTRARYIQEARQKDFTICGIEFHLPLAVALERQKTRKDKTVPDNVVKDMYMNQQSLLLGSEVDTLLHVNAVTHKIMLEIQL